MIEFIEDILKERDKHKYNTIEWQNLNLEKAFILEDLKPSWKELTAYYPEFMIKNIPYGFTKTNELPPEPIYENKRSLLEYNGGCTKQIIPYCLLRYKDEYYIAIRENNGDKRLNGKMAGIGGHVDKNLTQGMMREIEEETGVTPDLIEKIEFVGIIKSEGNTEDIYDVSKDHIGLVYIVDLKTKKIRMQELGVQTAIFLKSSDFHKYQDRFEDWLDLIVRNLFFS